MVLDTKWKKFKYSNGNKFLCAVLACVMVVVLMCNVLQAIKCFVFFEDEVLGAKAMSFYETNAFIGSFNEMIGAIETEVTADSRAKEKAAYVNAFLESYTKAAEENRMTLSELKNLVSGTNDWDYDITHDSNEPDILPDGTEYYMGDDRYYYTEFMVTADQSIAEIYDSRNGLYFGHNDDYVRSKIGTYYDNNIDYFSGYYDPSSFRGVKNIQYYAVHKDKTVITNVQTDVNAFIKSVKNGEGDFVAYEPAGKGYSSSESLEFFERYDSFISPNKDFSIYVQIDSGFKADDYFKYIHNNYLDAAKIDIAFVCINIFVSFVLLIVLAVFSCRIAGHKNGTLSMAKLDKVPADLHFVLMVAAVGCAGLGVGVIIGEYAYCLARFVRYYNYQDFEHQFYSSPWLYVVICILSILIWLMVLSFATSISRAVKSNYPVLSKLLVVKIIVSPFKGLRKCLRTLAFKPKKLSKWAVVAVVLYTLFNFAAVGIIILLLASYDGIVNFFGIVGTIALLGADGYMVYRAVKYMKSLDSIIAASENGESLPYNTDELPFSLKVLADSLQSTNAQLQQAVAKAVKDEKTKTELITNVSHDLKTPLTSVINYIDLLQKCDIEDEDAKKYLAVIAEKSNKLKRLIEDLIEASKVSTGNVAINKTLINLNELAAQAIVEESADIEKNNLHIIFEEPVENHIVMADGTKIYRVFENLLSNARKYSASGSRVYVSVYSDAHYGYFEIKNISNEQLNITAEELTERFVRGDKSRSQDGNGLGLSIAKELCVLNNGELIISIDGDLFKATVKLPKN